MAMIRSKCGSGTKAERERERAKAFLQWTVCSLSRCDVSVLSLVLAPLSLSLTPNSASPSSPPPSHRQQQKKNSYIKWTQATYKSGAARSRLLPLLERATRALGPACPDAGLRERYRGDVRYLRVWVQYVSSNS